MSILQRITTEYIDIEDRVKVSTECLDGEFVVLWFSQRMLTRLLPHMITWTQKQDIQLSHQELPLSQERDAETLSSAPAVSVSEDCPQYLVNSIDISSSPEALALCFKSGIHHYTLSLKPDALLFWLEILHALWDQAEWTATPWVSWQSHMSGHRQQDKSITIH